MTTSSTDFFDVLNWINRKPLVIEPYRREIFRRALDERRPDGTPRYNQVLCGRAKKNWKSSDLVLAGLFCLVCRESPQGSDVLLIGNDEDQAVADLDLAKKIIAANPDLSEDLEVLSKEIRRRDNRGIMRVLPAGNAIGEHGRTAAFVGFDEIHGFRNWDLLEALAPDPTRTDTLTWITSYDTVYDVEGVPLHDLKQIGMAGTDERMLFSWYSADYCTDPAFADLPPDERANPSMSSWPEGRAYLAQQRRRLPSARFRRLHHNLPGAPQGAHFDQGQVDAAIIAGRQVIEPRDGIDYLAAVDMSGGSSDDAVLAIAHWDGRRAILDCVVQQAGNPPFNPRRDAVDRFAALCHRYRCRTVHGDSYAGETFRRDFSDHGIDYVVAKQTRTDWYEALEVALNSGQVELLDVPKLRRQILTIVRRGAVLDHQPGQHDDWANAAAAAVVLVNPDLGNPEPAILTHYKRQVDAASTRSAPTLIQQHVTEPVMQIGTRRPANWVAVRIPTESSVIYGASGHAYVVEIADGERVAWMSLEDAKCILCSAAPSSLQLREANRALTSRLQTDKDIPAEPAGVRASDTILAALDQREAKRPENMSAGELAQHMLASRGAILNETLGLMGRGPP